MTVTPRTAAVFLLLVVIVASVCGFLALTSLAVIAIVSFVATKVLLTKLQFLPNLIPASLLTRATVCQDAPSKPTQGEDEHDFYSD